MDLQVIYIYTGEARAGKHGFWTSDNTPACKLMFSILDEVTDTTSADSLATKDLLLPG